jgi:hypothetical protein
MKILPYMFRIPVNYIGSSAFLYGCTRLNKRGNSYSELALIMCIYDCSSLTSGSIGNGVTEIQDKLSGACCSASIDPLI